MFDGVVDLVVLAGVESELLALGGDSHRDHAVGDPKIVAVIIHATFAAWNFSSGSQIPGVSGKNAPIAAMSATRDIRIAYLFMIVIVVLSKLRNPWQKTCQTEIQGDRACLMACGLHVL